MEHPESEGTYEVSDCPARVTDGVESMDVDPPGNSEGPSCVSLPRNGMGPRPVSPSKTGVESMHGEGPMGVNLPQNDVEPMGADPPLDEEELVEVDPPADLA